jgi:hypothetical protein
VIARAACLVLAGTFAVASNASSQTGVADVNSAAGLHEVLFRVPQGGVGIWVAGDAAPGDQISGVVRTQAIGASPVDQERNQNDLNGFLVEWQGQKATPVSDHQYKATIPATLRTGRVTVTLRSRDGKAIAEGVVPIDGVPAPAVPRPAGPPRFELPTESRMGGAAVIRGPFDGLLAEKTVRIGTATASVIAVSPRRIVFQAPLDVVGEASLQLSSGANTAQGTIRVFRIDMSLTKQALQHGEKATLLARVSGLQNLAAPVTMTIKNASPDVVTLDSGNLQSLTIAPANVSADGSVTVSRTLTGGMPGALRIQVFVSGRPFALFDVARATAATLATWETATGIRITPEGRERILESIREARPALEQVLSLQQADLADPRDVFAALLSNYCFDLRDEKPRVPPKLSRHDAALPVVRFAAFAQGRAAAPAVQLDASDVQRLSFTDFISRFVARFSASQPVGYLLITSKPASSGITIDGQRKGEMTNRRFVTSVGDHEIVIAGESKTCDTHVKIGAFQITVVACEP